MGRTASAVAAETIFIGSKLPTGLILHHPADPSIKVTIKGLNSAPRGQTGHPIYIPYALTEIDLDFWNAWKLEHDIKGQKRFPALTSGAIFEAKDEDAAKEIAKDYEKRKTGLEPMSQTATVDGVKLKPADKD